MDVLTIVLTGLVVFTTFTLEGISGFGSTVLALPFISMLLGLGNAVPLLSTMSWVLALFVIVRSWRNISWREYGFIMLHMIPGLVAGMFLASILPEDMLLAILAAFMMFAGIRGVRATLKAGRATPSPYSNLYSTKETDGGKAPADSKSRTWTDRLCLLLGGVIHGAFSSGGPLVIIYAAKVLKDKSLFRVTLCLLWFMSNSLMIALWTFIKQVWTPELIRAILCAFPFVLGGIVLGDFLHSRVNDKLFRLLVFSVLIVSAVILSVRVGLHVLS